MTNPCFYKKLEQFGNKWLPYSFLLYLIMQENHQKPLFILSMVAAVVVLTLMCGVNDDSAEVLPDTLEEQTSESGQLPEDKILDFMADRLRDVWKVFPQKGQVNTLD